MLVSKSFGQSATDLRSAVVRFAGTPCTSEVDVNTDSRTCYIYYVGGMLRTQLWPDT